jgi:hypothetical protein
MDSYLPAQWRQYGDIRRADMDRAGDTTVIGTQSFQRDSWSIATRDAATYNDIVSVRRGDGQFSFPVPS